MEGSLRVPFLIRWPGQVPEHNTTNELVHVTDVFTTILAMGGVEELSDRPIDGIDQTRFLNDSTNEKSKREGFLFYIKDELRALKWINWKLHLVWEPKVNQSSGHLESPYLFNTTRNPKDETDILAYNTWVLQPMMRLRADFQKSLRADPAQLRARVIRIRVRKMR